MKMLFCLLLSISISQLVFAHAEHAPKVVDCKEAGKCTKDEVTSAAPKALELLTQKGGIEKTWLSKKPDSVEQKSFKKGSEWVVTYSDPSQPKEKQKLFVFITLKGFLNGANHTGE